MEDRKKKIKQAAKWTGGLGGAGSLFALAALDPDKALAMAEETLKSNYGPLLALSGLAWHLFLKPLLLHLVDVRAELKGMKDCLEEIKTDLRLGDQRMTSIEARLVKGGL